MRPCVQVRSAGPDDMTELVALCLAARAESGAGSQLCSDDGSRLHAQLAALVATPGGQALVGSIDDRPVGLLLGRVTGPTLFSDDVAMHVEAVYVEQGSRRRGVGHALMAGALAVAEDAGATDVFSAPLPGARGMQRFLARLGFAPAASHRVVTTHFLQRRLASEGTISAGRRPSARAIEDLIARRRQVRSALASLADEQGASNRGTAAGDAVRVTPVARRG